MQMLQRSILHQARRTQSQRAASATAKSKFNTSRKISSKRQNFNPEKLSYSTFSSSSNAKPLKIVHAGRGRRSLCTFVGDEDNELRMVEITSNEDRKYYESILAEANSPLASEAKSFHSVLTFLPHQEGAKIPKQAILGWLKERAPISKKTRDFEIEPLNFVENPFFADFLHDVISKAALESWDLKILAGETGSGWMNIYDRRSPFPGVRRNAEDIFGSIKLEGGQMVPGSYERMPAHRLVTLEGPFKLDSAIHEKFLEILKSLPTPTN